MEEHEIDLHRLKKLCEDHHVVYLYTLVRSLCLPTIRTTTLIYWFNLKQQKTSITSTIT